MRAGVDGGTWKQYKDMVVAIDTGEEQRCTISHLPSEFKIPEQHKEKSQTKKGTEKNKCDLKKWPEKNLPEVGKIFRVQPCLSIGRLWT